LLDGFFGAAIAGLIVWPFLIDRLDAQAMMRFAAQKRILRLNMLDA
jgi:hypothetical protein